MNISEITPLIAPAGLVLTGFWAVFSWSLNLREKRRMDAYTRKEQVYKDIIVNLQALYKVNNPIEKQRFIDQKRIAWIYCPDEVVRQLNACLDAVTPTDSPSSPQQAALGKAVVAMRKDLLDTTLTHQDFRHVSG